MTSINNQEDFLRALAENPEWRGAVRAQLLDEELLQLPARFNAFVEEMAGFVAEMKGFVAEQKAINARLAALIEGLRTDVDELKVTVGRIDTTVGQLAEDMAETKDHLGRLDGTVTRLDGTVHQLTEDMAETKDHLGRLDRSVHWLNDEAAKTRGHRARDVAERDAEVIALDMGLEYRRLLSRGELARMALKAAAGSPLSDDLKSFRQADLVIEATDSETVQYIAVEASYTGGQRDTDRAMRNADFLTQFTGLPARAAIASIRNTDEVNHRIVSGDVYWHEIVEKEIEPD